MIFTYYPMIKGSLMAFQSYNLMNVKNIKWVGLDNFSKLFAHNTSNRSLAFIRSRPAVVEVWTL